MDNIDEKIAKLKMQQRLEKEKQQRKESEEENLISEEEKLTIEEVMKQVDEGSLNINNTNFKFERKMFLSDKLEIPIPLVYFEERVNTDKNTALVND